LWRSLSGERAPSAAPRLPASSVPSARQREANATPALRSAYRGLTRCGVSRDRCRHDLASSDALDKELAGLLEEDQIYRIDHYLGKEMVQNLSAVRFGNAIFEPLWNRHHIASVTVTFKEDITVEGRAGYFDGIGLIRDVMQNHLLQLVTLVAMEAPTSLDSEDVRDEKVKVLRAMRPLSLDDVILGQYEGYTFDPEVPDGSKTETYAMATMHIDNQRWAGVPFIVKCGKAVNERKCEIRVQFEESPLPYHQGANRNEFVLRVQPDEAMYLKTNMKRVGARKRHF
jgi:glucose-6-phosphate 1-dehydrogenase